MGRPLGILHVLRAPVGGLFRHVADLARAQSGLGHRVGIIADSETGGPRAQATLAALEPHLALGLSRIPMSRHLGWRDLAAVTHVGRRIGETGARVVHGHGAKGGAYARLAARGRAVRVYTPHGGSLHYARSSPLGLLYLTLERLLAPRTELFLFESAYGRTAFFEKVGEPKALVRVVHNGVAREEFEGATPDPNAAEFLFIGELRRLKGVDVLIDALAELGNRGRDPRLAVVGEGPDRPAFEAQAAALGLENRIRFFGAMPARQAFSLGRVLVVPSRAESLPYVVLEAAAACVPLVATNVGGIHEIFGSIEPLVAPGDPQALAAALDDALRHPDRRLSQAKALQDRVRTDFSVENMTRLVLEAYALALPTAEPSRSSPVLSIS